MAIDLWKVESLLYAWIDAEGMRFKNNVIKSFDIGNNHSVDIRVNNFTKKPIYNHSKVRIEEFIFSLNFRKNNKPWLRIDNESKEKHESCNYLHFHLQTKTQLFDKHQKLHKEYTVAELISFTFDWVYKILDEKFSDEIIKDSKGFVGTC